MKNLELDDSGNDNPWRIVLTGLKPDNVEEIYNRELTRWRVFHSDSKFLDGKELTFDEFILMYIGNGFENLDPNKFEVNNENEGFPLEEKTFIKEQIVKYEYISKDTEGSALNRTVHLKCELYLDHLRKRSNLLKKSLIDTSLDHKNNVIAFKDLFQEKQLFNEVIDLLMEHNFLETAQNGKWKLSNFAQPGGLSEKKITSALGFVLKQRNYFKEGTDMRSIAKGLDEFFSLELKYHTYRKNHIEFEDIEESSRLGRPLINNTKCYEYLSIFHMIKPQQNRYNRG